MSANHDSPEQLVADFRSVMDGARAQVQLLRDATERKLKTWECGWGAGTTWVMAGGLLDCRGKREAVDHIEKQLDQVQEIAVPAILEPPPGLTRSQAAQTAISAVQNVVAQAKIAAKWADKPSIVQYFDSFSDAFETLAVKLAAKAVKVLEKGIQEGLKPDKGIPWVGIIALVAGGAWLYSKIKR